MNLGLASCEHKLGQVALHRGDRTEAAARFARSLAVQREMGNKQGIAECLAAAAGLAIAAGDLGLSATILAGTEEFLTSFGAPLAPADRLEMETDIKRLQDLMESERFEIAWYLGRRQSVDQLIEKATGYMCR